MMRDHYSRRQAMTFLSSGVASLGLAQTTSARSNKFVINDRVVSDPHVSLKDPDFDNYNFRIAWHDNAGSNGGGNIWIADVNPLTGELFPANGQGLQVGTGEKDGYNGVTWGFTASGLGIYYTKNDPPLNGSLGVVNFNPTTNTWTDGFLPGGTDYLGPYPSLDIYDTMGLRIFYKTANSQDTQIAYWGYLDSTTGALTNPTLLPAGTDRGRWIPGKRSLIMNIKTTNRIQQTYQYDVDTALLTQLTFDAGTKNYSYMWKAPEFNNDYIFFNTVQLNDVNGVYVGDAMNFYSYDPVKGKWINFYSFDYTSLAPKFPFFLSPQQFIYNGRSYVFIELQTQAQVQNRQYPNLIWIAGIDKTNPFFRQVSAGDPTNKNALNQTSRNNPKAFFLADGRPYIYYQEKTMNDNPYMVSGGTRILHICDTGL